MWKDKVEDLDGVFVYCQYEVFWRQLVMILRENGYFIIIKNVFNLKEKNGL